MIIAASRGRLTIRTAAALFILSALVELVSVTTPVPLAGTLRAGAPGVLYHLLYVIVFLAMGIGLWTGRPWGLPAVFAGTSIYTADKVRYVLDRDGQAAEILYQLRNFPEIAEVLDMNVLLRMSALMTATFVLCWWGFAAYVYLRRNYFTAVTGPRAADGMG